MKRELHVQPHASRYGNQQRWCVRFHRNARAYMVFPDAQSALTWAWGTPHRLIIHRQDGSVERTRE